ncbi:MarR family transcriptional regulator [Erythrobacter sp. SG61-1L]|uniref:MarR family winged helix-turn-helix transcriptional regulator n=1 Tax=Erythrobacter sp. SG61-1L TaxID=1603897 RepID=UPI0006C8EF50|nr:MarR family transcriptional regulator [Erythrobacter sp. SG61-1L]KPL68225.1 MarR family transcriptional regulator [Erythrobacter sp. SG61-1L]
MRDPLVNRPGYSLRRASSAMTAELTQRLGEQDLRIVDATVLMWIDENPQVTASALGRALDIQRANMVPLLKKLEDSGLVERAPIDGKSQGLSLSELGQQRVVAVRDIVDRFEQELLARIPLQHREHFIPALDALWR